MVEGNSGILAVHPPDDRPEYQPSKRRVVWSNGSIATGYSSDAPDQLRGPQFHYSWGDETAAWPFVPDASGLNAYDNMRIATRLGDLPQTLITTTPKRTPFMQELLASEGDGVVITRGSTASNRANLSQAYIDLVYGLYDGTSLKQQELDGVLLDEVEGALWTDELLAVSRVSAPPPLALRCVAVDPSVAEDPRDECGIIVVGATNDKAFHRRHGYVLEDASLHGSPDKWARRVVETAQKWACPVVAETNQGAALVKMTLETIDPRIRVIEVHARQGKALRAEPVVSAYEQGRVHHVNYLPELEAQLTSWVPGTTKKSPDRLDALVHGLTALVVRSPRELVGGALRARSFARRTLPVKTGVMPRSLRR